MKLRKWAPWLFLAIYFIFAGIVKLIDKSYPMAIAFIVMGLCYLVLTITNYKNANKPSIVLSEEDLENMNIELKKLIKEDKKNEAIKRYRTITGLGLKEAYEYVEALS